MLWARRPTSRSTSPARCSGRQVGGRDSRAPSPVHVDVHLHAVMMACYNEARSCTHNNARLPSWRVGDNGISCVVQTHADHCCCAAGLMVTERNWLLVFHYTTWGGNANLPHFVEGMQFSPTEVRPPAHAPSCMCVALTLAQVSGWPLVQPLAQLPHLVKALTTKNAHTQART